MSPRVRVLTSADTSRLVALCERDPFANLAILAKVRQFPTGTRGLVMLGSERDGELTSVCCIHGNGFIAGDDPEALDSFATHCLIPRVGSLSGSASQVLAFHQILSDRLGGCWSTPRNIRACQPLMVWLRPSEVAPDPNVRQLTEAEYASYFEASVKMYIEELGVNPLDSGQGYKDAVRRRIREGHALGIVRDGRVLFKADLGISLDDRTQIQGVWLDPELRGRGLAAPAMTGVLSQIADDYPHVSLYVNAFNTPAIRTYQRCGFVRVGTMATVHY